MEENKKHDEIDNRIQIFCDFISQNYTPVGESEDKVFKTSQELAYQIRETCEITAQDISVVMSRAGFKIRFIDGVPSWELFEKFTY